MSGLNALQIMSYVAPYPGNFIRAIIALERRLKDAGATSVYVFPRSMESRPWVAQFAAEGRVVRFLDGRIVSDAAMLVGLIRKYRIKIVHSHFVTSPIHLATFLARKACPSVVSIVHMHNHARKDPSRLKEGLKRALVSPSAYVCVSDDVRDDMVAKGYSPERCVSVPNAIEFSRLDQFDATPATDLPADGKRVLLFGFDYERKGVDLAIEALRTHDPEHRMVLLIALAANPEQVATKIKAMLGGELPAWIRLLPAREDIATYYRRSDVFITPSREEGFCYALVEAAYCGVPIVASDISGQRSLKIPHTLSFATEDVRGLYERMKEATELTPARRQVVTAEARDYVVSQFRMSDWVDRIVQVYKARAA
jgi:glycosyltransferase involved in cell wall biosynthesis